MEAERIRKSEFVGIGCVFQAIGIALLFFFPIGTFIGVVLFVYGWIKSVHWVCGNCRNPLADGDVRVCPACHANIVK